MSKVDVDITTFLHKALGGALSGVLLIERSLSIMTFVDENVSQTRNGRKRALEVHGEVSCMLILKLFNAFSRLVSRSWWLMMRFERESISSSPSVLDFLFFFFASRGAGADDWRAAEVVVAVRGGGGRRRHRRTGGRNCSRRSSRRPVCLHMKIFYPWLTYDTLLRNSPVKVSQVISGSLLRATTSPMWHNNYCFSCLPSFICESSPRDKNP